MIVGAKQRNRNQTDPKKMRVLALSDRLGTFLFAVGRLFFATSSLPRKQIKICTPPNRQACVLKKSKKISRGLVGQKKLQKRFFPSKKNMFKTNFVSNTNHN